MGIELTHLRQKFHARDSRHLQVGNDNVRLLLFENAKGLCTDGQFERARGPTHFEPKLRRRQPAPARRKTGEEGSRQFCNLTLGLLPHQISYSSENASDGAL